MRILQLGESQRAILIQESEIVSVVEDGARMMNAPTGKWTGDWQKDGLADYYNHRAQVEAEMQ